METLLGPLRASLCVSLHFWEVIALWIMKDADHCMRADAIS